MSQEISIASQSAIKELNVAELQPEDCVQTRVKMSQKRVIEYAKKMVAGVVFLPIMVFFDGAKYWVADGAHRLHAAKSAGMSTILAEVRVGTARDALLYSLGANDTHGLKRSNADKRNAVDIALADSVWRNWSDKKIGDMCGVSDRFVAKRRRLSSNGSQVQRTVTRGGVTFDMNIRNIGKINEAEKSPENEASDAAFLEHLRNMFGPEDDYFTNGDAPAPKVKSKKVKSSVVKNSDSTVEAVASKREPSTPVFSIPKDWSNQTWISITGEHAKIDPHRAILLTIPDAMSLSEGLQIIVEHARDLGCTAFVSPDLQSLIEACYAKR